MMVSHAVCSDLHNDRLIAELKRAKGKCQLAALYLDSIPLSTRPKRRRINKRETGKLPVRVVCSTLQSIPQRAACQGHL